MLHDFAPRLRALALGLMVGACSSSHASRGTAPEQPLAASANTLWKERVRALREREDALRSSFSPRTQPPWIDVSGADPYRIARSANGAGFVGILRGAKAFVRLSPELVEQERVTLAETPTALCVSSANEAWVASRYGRLLVRLTLGADGTTTPTLERELPFAGVADLACGSAGVVYVQPANGSELQTLDRAGHVLGQGSTLPGPLRLARRGRYLLRSSLFERSLEVILLGQRGIPGGIVARIQHDGTLWAFDALERVSDVLLAVAGVEDKPLVRAHGEFENIDSFVWLYRLRDGRAERIAELDVSDLGLVLPKAVQLRASADGVTLTALAAGSGKLLKATWSADFSVTPKVEISSAPPGVSDAVFEDDGDVVYASPLFDAWIRLSAAGARFARVDPATRPSPDVRLGEALFFTQLMAPDNLSDGTHSRFSCETCHFEGGVDGRVHYTGRADVSVVTKPLFGLANNRPHFSRAMDPDLSSVCHNEFRVAGAGSGKDPWFSLQASRFPWLYELGIDRAELGPLELRTALLDFLYAFSHAPNAEAQGRRHFSATEAAGAKAFERHCQRCHDARLATDDASSAVQSSEWESLILSRNAPLVWASKDYGKTGVVPYVHEQGTRVSSLRRLALKPRYFTNGSAPDLADVLERFRDGPSGALHDTAGDVQGSPLSSLSAPERAELLSFLKLL